jgi:Uma2 family endonuclease
LSLPISNLSRFPLPAAFTLPNGAIRGPNIAWILRQRWDALTTEEQERFSHLAPDFVVELPSPWDRLPALREKMREYIAQGVRLGWLIDAHTKTAEIHRAGREPEVLIKPTTLAARMFSPGLFWI